MKKFVTVVMMMASAFFMTINDAEAKRMGGGGSSGRQSQNVSKQQAPAQQGANQTQPATPAAAPGATPAKSASPWKGMLGGALLGLGLGALLSSFGIGGALASMISTLLMAGIGVALVMFVFRMLKKKPTSSPFQTAYAGANSYNSTPEIGSRLNSDDTPKARETINGSGFGSNVAAEASDATWDIPADFDVPGFERNAKTYFIRLQAAWDKADINDIREFTTPEMYAEVKLQIQERGAGSNVTDVLTINSKLLGIETQGADYLASVKFTGTIKEAPDAPTESFDEVWNLVKSMDGAGGWLLAGIQQVA